MGTYIQLLMQRDQVQAVLRELNALMRISLESKTNYLLLESISRGLYEEMERLNRSGPDVPITERAMGQVNYTLTNTVPLMERDEDVRSFVTPFDPNRGVPVHRDTVLALCQARLGLERYIARQALDARIETIESRTAEAEAILGSLDIAVQRKRKNVNENGAVLRRDLEESGGTDHPNWFRDFSNNLSRFHFAKLNKTDILRYFLADLLGDYFDESMANL